MRVTNGAFVLDNVVVPDCFLELGSTRVGLFIRFQSPQRTRALITVRTEGFRALGIDDSRTVLRPSCSWAQNGCG